MPWQVPITVDGLEYPVTFNTENEPTQQDYDEAIQQILQQQQPASELPTEPTATPEKELPFFDLSDIGSSLGQAVTSLGRTIPASFGQLYEGTMNPWEKGPESLQRQKEMRDVQREAEKAQAEAEASGDASIIGRSIRSAQPSLGFSLTTLPASLGAGAVTGLGTAYLSGNPIIAQRAGMAAGSAAGGYAAYRMAGSQFLDDARERIDNFFLEKEGRLPNKQEQDEAYQELLPLAQEMGMAEALPEAFGNLALAGAGKYIYRILGGKTGVQQLASGALSKVKGMNALKAVGAGAAGAGTEVLTEAGTDVLQESPYKKLEEGIMQGQPVEAVEIPPFTLERFKQGVERVVEPTLATTAMMGLVGGAGGMAYRGLTRKSFEETEFRDKMTKQAESAEKQLSSPDITPAQRKFLADKVEESNAALKALDEGRSSDVEKYFNVRFTKAEEPSMPSPDEVAIQLNTDAAKSLEAAGSSKSAEAQAGFDATLKGILGSPTKPTVQPEQAAEAARIAEEQRKAAANAIPKANVPPPPSPVITPESTVEELRAELTLRENARRTLDFGDQGNTQIDNDIQTLNQEIQSRSAKPPVVTAPPATLPPAEALPVTPAVTPTDFNTRNKDMLPDEGNFGGKFTKPLQIDPTSYRRDGEIETVNYINPETGNTDVFISAFGGNDFIAYMRQYDKNGNPTNTFTSKLERRTKKAGVTKKMLQLLQSRLPEGHSYTEDFSVSTDGLRFFLNQLNQGYEPVIENGRPVTASVAISGESIQNDLPIPVDPTGKFEPIRITNPKDFAKVKTYLGKMLEGFGVGLNESNVIWENGDVLIDLPVLRKVTPSPKMGEPVTADLSEKDKFNLIANDLIPLKEYSSKEDLEKGARSMEALIGLPTNTLTPVRSNVSKVFRHTDGSFVKLATAASNEDFSKIQQQLDLLAGYNNLAELPKLDIIMQPEGGGVIYVMRQMPVGIEGVQIHQNKNFTKKDQALFDELQAQNPLSTNTNPNPALRVETDSALKNMGLVVGDDGMVRAIAFDFDGIAEEDILQHGEEAKRILEQQGNAPMKGVPLSSFSPSIQKAILDGQAAPPSIAKLPTPPSPKMEQAAAPAVEEPTLTPEPELYAPAQVPSEESVYEEPQDRVEGREKEEPSLGDSLLRSKKGKVEEEVMPPPKVAADPFAATPLVDNLPALIAVRDNNATPEQVQSLVDQGLVERVGDQNIITEAGVAAMPEGERPKLTPDERAAEVKGMTVPVFTRNEIIVSKPSVSRRSRPNGVDGESITEIKAPSKVTSPDNWNRLGDIEKLDATVEARLDFATGKVPKKTDKSWTAFAGRKTKAGRSVLARNVTYNEAIEAAKDFVESANFQPQPTAAEKPTPDSVAVEPGATRGVQPEPVGGSIPTVGEVSPETEISSRENLGPEVAAAEQKQAADDEAAKKRQKKQDESTKNSLNSVLDPQKKNAVTGTVTKVDVETARETLTNSGEIPNAYLTNVYESLEAFLADKANARLFPSAYARLQTEKNIEGLYENGQTLIFAKQIQVSNLDRNLAKMLGITPEQAAARRVIAHENGHKAISLFTLAEKRELRGYLMRAYSDEQIAKLVETYDEYADWRTNLESRFEALEELLMRDFERMDKIPTGGVWDDIVQFLKRVWRRLTGQKGEPTLKNLKDVARLMRNAMKRPAVPLGSFTLKDGGKVKLSFIGEKAIENLPEERRQFMRDSLEAAKAMAAAGKDSEEIRAVTGWFPGKYDGKMRFEIPDKEASLRLSEYRKARNDGESPQDIVRKFFADKQAKQQEEALFFIKGMPKDELLKFSRDFTENKKKENSRLFEFFARGDNRDNGRIPMGYLLDHSVLFEAYPELFWTPVSFNAKDVGFESAGQANLDGSIGLNPAIAFNDEDSALSTLLHEAQHLIQKQEGFAKGSSMDRAALRQGWDYYDESQAIKDYRRTAGEIEARDVQARQNLTPEQRAATAPYSSENIAPEDAIVMFGGGGAQMSMAAPEMDAEYLAAVEAGDMETAQRMVNEAVSLAVVRRLQPEWGAVPESDRITSRFKRGDSFDLETLQEIQANYEKWAKKAGIEPTDLVSHLSGGGGAVWTAYGTQDRFVGQFIGDVFAVSHFAPSGNKAAVDSLLDLLNTETPVVFAVPDAIAGQLERVGFQRSAIRIPMRFKGAIQHKNLLINGAVSESDVEKLAAWWVASSRLNGLFEQLEDARTLDAAEKGVRLLNATAEPVLRDRAGNVIPPSQRFQPTSPDIRFSRPQFASDTDAATSAGNEAARSTIYSERDMDVREAIRRAYEAMPKDTSVAVPIGELFSKTEEMLPDVTQDEFSNVLQDLFEDNGAVLQEGGQIIPEQEVEIQAFEKENPFNELIRKSSEKSPSLGEINGVSKKFVQRVLRPASSFATNNGIRIDDNAPLQARAMPDGSIIIGYSLSQERFDELQKMAPQAASQYTKDSVIEELIHVSDLIGLRNQWIKSGKKIAFDQFVLGEQSNLAFSLIQKADSLNDLERESLRRILASSLSLYSNNPEIANLGLNELLDLAAQYPYVLPELVRYLIQLKKTGQLTETAFRKIANVLREWQEIVLQWISDGYASAKEGVFGEMLSERIKNAENNLAQLSDTSEINVTTPEGRRAGFVVVMPRPTKASRIRVEDAEEASKSFKVDLAEAGKGRVDKKAKFKGNPLKETEIPEHNVKSYVLYRDSAIKLIDDLMAKTNDILVVAEALQDPEFQIAIGLQVSKDVSSDMITIARSQIGIEIENRLANEIRKERNPRRKRELELAEKRGIIYYNAGTGAGQALQNRQESLTDPRYRGRNIFNQAKLQKEQKAKDKLDAITGGTDKITDIITGAEEKAAEETTQAEVEAQESVAEDDEYAKLVSEGEEGLEGRRKTIWERAKMILRRLAMYARADKLDIKEGSKASLSAEQRKELDELNAILRMPKAERDKAREKDLAEFDALMTEFLGLESEAKTSEQKKTRKKREKMVNTAKKRAEAGKSLETPQEGEVESSEEQVSKAERTAQAILKDLSERYSDPLIIKEKKPNVDAMRELYKERVKQGVGPNQMTEKSFVNKAVELGADETTAGILWKAAELEIDAREAMRQDKILQRKAAVGARADAQAHRIIFAKERLKRQSGFAGIDTNPNKDTIIQAFRDQVKNPVSLEDFVARLKSLNVSETVAKRLFTAAEREKADLEAMEAFKALEGPDALKRMLNEMNKARPADSVPLERAMPWRKILSSNPKDVAEYRQRIFEAISDLPSFQNLTDEQKERLADLYAEAWENRRQAILDRMLRDEIKKARDRDEISEDVEKKLQQSRNKILEIVNLGGFNNDDLVKILGERYGISTSFTEEQKERIQKLADQLQDEDMNTAKRNKLAMEFAVELAGAMDVPVSEIISNWWTSSVLFGPQTIFSIGAAFLNGGYSIATIGTRRMLAKLFKGDIQGAIEESILMLKGFARYLGAFKQSGRRAWNYLWTGDVGLLGTGSTDILNEINNFDQLQRFQRHKLLAEQLAKDPRMVRRYVGVYLRFVSRLLTALDAFNVMVTKAGTASLALRMSGMSTDKIIEAEKMLNLKAYKEQVIRDYFDNKAPKTQAEKALVDSYAEAEMYRAINKLGGKMENADYLASESAMTMHPTGFGGVVYDAITGFFAQRQSNADEYLEKMKKDWISNKDLKAVTFLALAYLRQFAAYNAAGLTGSKFVRYASNKFNQGLSFIPFAGLLRQLEAKDDKIKGKDAFRETIYRNQIVSFVMLMVGYSVIKAIQDEPDDEERGNFWNGGWSNLTPDQKKQMLAKGQKEYTMGFKFNGRWYVFNYQNWPLNQILSAIGSMSDQIRFSPEKWDEKSALSKGVAGMVSGVKSTLEIPALSGLQELVGNRLASKDPTEKELDRLSRVASGWVGGFVPRILKDIDFYTQPELRKYEGLWEKTASHIPIYRRYVGEEYYDILGKQIKRNVIPGSREFMMGPTEPEYKILGALNARNIFLTPANAEYRMIGKGRNRRRLTQEEADAYSLETGRGYRDMLLRYGQRALQMPTERARAFLQDKAEEVRDRALKRAYRR